MENGLYRIEVKADFESTADRTNLPEQDDAVMITHKRGITVATLHRLHINAKPKEKDPGPCEKCFGRKASINMAMTEPGKIEFNEINYCARCGRRLDV